MRYVVTIGKGTEEIPADDYLFIAANRDDLSEQLKTFIQGSEIEENFSSLLDEARVVIWIDYFGENFEAFINGVERDSVDFYFTSYDDPKEDFQRVEKAAEWLKLTEPNNFDFVPDRRLLFSIPVHLEDREDVFTSLLGAVPVDASEKGTLYSLRVDKDRVDPITYIIEDIADSLCAEYGAVTDVEVEVYLTEEKSRDRELCFFVEKRSE